jgi:hypothetical protein
LKYKRRANRERQYISRRRDKIFGFEGSQEMSASPIGREVDCFVLMKLGKEVSRFDAALGRNFDDDTGRAALGM